MPNNFDLLCEDNLIEVLDCLIGPEIKSLGLSNKRMYKDMKTQRVMEHVIRRLYLQNREFHKIIKNNAWSFSTLRKYI
jgi:hypothetical protein